MAKLKTRPFLVQVKRLKIQDEMSSEFRRQYCTKKRKKKKQTGFKCDIIVIALLVYKSVAKAMGGSFFPKIALMNK